MIITRAISGNLILNEKASQSYLQLWGYACSQGSYLGRHTCRWGYTCSISVILFGLVNCR